MYVIMNKKAQFAPGNKHSWNEYKKQELNFSHLVSLSKNGIEVMVYMTLIVSMLILIYKKANNLGYKTVKRRFVMELRELITAIMILFLGGDPSKVFKT